MSRNDYPPQTIENESGRLPVIAIVGRPNVGKSSLFNAIIGRRMAIVHEQSGVTRDRVAATGSFHGQHFQLIDTGGLGTMGASRNIDKWDEHIASQVFQAIENADVLIMVVNVQQGIVPLDEAVAEELRSTGKPVIVAANKSDNPALGEESVEFSRWGFADLAAISCLHRYGIDNLLEKVFDLMPQELKQNVPTKKSTDIFEQTSEDSTPEIKPLRIAIVGRPNVGKSSLVNALLGEERVITSDVAGTTRDAVDIDFSIKFHGEQRPAILVDTAGLRKTAKVHDAVEKFSVMRAESAIEHAELVIMTVEAGENSITAQDRRIAGLIERNHKPCIITANKYDLCASEAKIKELHKMLRNDLPGLAYAPVVFTSAVKRLHLNTLLDMISTVAEQLELRPSTALVNRVILDAFERLSPPVVGVSPLKLYYATMTNHVPPHFLLFVNKAANCAPNYKAYLAGEMRKAFGFIGVPVLIDLRDRPKKVTNFHTPGRGEPPRRNKRRK
ncbi:MAG: ribosome biogenesis GTPase Der [Lentisphaerae bacterium]|nr:ribosome biogenesis GTPase Der [Lentisphaerota bacterium]